MKHPALYKVLDHHPNIRQIAIHALALSPPPQSTASGHQISPPSTARRSAYWRTLRSDAQQVLRCSALEGAVRLMIASIRLMGAIEIYALNN